MAPSKVVTGARAVVKLAQLGGTPKTVGIFNNVSYGLTFGAEPIHILGRYSPDEIVYTAQDAVSIRASGWRVVDHGAHVDALVPRLQDLLRHEYIQMQIVDRQTGKTLAHIRNVRPVGFDTSISSRNPEEISVTFMGLLVDDESGQNDETFTADTDKPTTLP